MDYYIVIIIKSLHIVLISWSYIGSMHLESLVQCILLVHSTHTHDGSWLINDYETWHSCADEHNINVYNIMSPSTRATYILW